MFPFFDGGNADALMQTVQRINEAKEKGEGVNLFSDEAKPLGEATKLLLEIWAESKTINPQTISFSSDTARFAKLCKSLKDNDLVTLTKEDVEFFLVEYRQLLDIISISRFGSTLDELKQKIEKQMGGEEDY